MTTEEAARRYAREHELGWREHDPARIAALYADGADLRLGPFGEPTSPLAHAESYVELFEPGIEGWFRDPAAGDDGWAVLEWWAVGRRRNGGDVTWAGISLLRFDDEGLVVEERAYWHRLDERRTPHENWWG